MNLKPNRVDPHAFYIIQKLLEPPDAFCSHASRPSCASLALPNVVSSSGGRGVVCFEDSIKYGWWWCVCVLKRSQGYGLIWGRI